MNVITIGGLPGSGTTTIAKILKKKMRMQYIYAGEIFRELAEEHGMSLAEFGRYCEKNPSIDRELDERQIEELKKGKLILEGRMAGWMAHLNKIQAFKIWLDCDQDIRIRRIKKREGTSDLKGMLEREKSEATRYKKYYGIDLKDRSIYDLIIDSSDKKPEKIVDIIMKKFHRDVPKIP